MKKIGLLLAFIVLELALLRLGFWQLDRAKEKQQQLDRSAAIVAHKQAIALNQAVGTPSDYTWVQGSVFFLAKPVLLLDNQRQGQRVGVRVFQMAASGTPHLYLIDLGWLPINGRRQMPRIIPLTGAYTVRGLLMPAPAAGFSLGASVRALGAGQYLLMQLDTVHLQHTFQHPLAPRVLRLDPDMPIGFARDLQILPNTLPPEKHRAYAVQWFAMAATLFILCSFLVIRKHHDRSKF